MYCRSNYYNTSIVVSHILSPISSRSPSVNIIGLKCVCLLDFCFFHDPPVYSCPRFFRMNGVLYPSLPPLPWSNNSCSSVLGQANLSPSYDFCYSLSVFSLAVCSFAKRAFCATALAASFFFCSVSGCTTIWAASFHFFTTELSAPMLVSASNFVGLHHSYGQSPTTS